MLIGTDYQHHLLHLAQERIVSQLMNTTWLLGGCYLS